MCDSNWKLTVAMCGIVNTKVMPSCEVRIVVYMCVCVCVYRCATGRVVQCDLGFA